MPSILIFLLVFASCTKNLPSPDKNQITILHYNIKELTTAKINDQKDDQLKAVKKVIAPFQSDILSINEIQYDLPGVPSLKNKTNGENLTKLAKRVGLNPAKWSQLFAPANTGSFAKRKSDGNYYVEESATARENADPVNYGLFPAQYSTAALINAPLSEKVSINKLKWIAFNPSANPSQYKMANDQSLPEEMPLFDKNFNHVVAKFYDKDVHLIFFHTVPSYHFGNKFTPNYKRNADQLKFLEWYVTGKTDFDVPLDRTQWPAIDKDSYVMVMGDLNADFQQKDNPGGFVLKRLMKKLKPWLENPGPTNESSGFGPNPFQLTLDYLLVSQNISISDAAVLRPESGFQALGCTKADMIKAKRDIRAKRKIIDYIDNKTKKKCYAAVSYEYYNAKTASDHFPIYAKLNLD
ncbi:MAG: hypothetical protein COW01_08040 [Bdellovibrionales bacterium CG12_big_fil_rev_8_21_14_0_65_38_15]|nr:MAG: hypothetical protein COW79_10750 [Bdellovibrionales bacterium CG22_combo_CG10-13_8_21_14_all_38_13]PIQ55320.1 MAG: hypothetical protein COW01_08040 [Bdellovibrionales bacterium CG12_big_fil_rev_8_21_14_0_65_38_15]PIR28930.1 MAG: hypothetical protein COV38_13085 [Bdellovibrionales bacterium CG11_big_fil_rev_8_21_14_0_20_38_13]